MACAAYRSGERLECEREGVAHDYRRKGGIVANGVELPEDAPEWAHDRQALWNHVEATEKRKDAQLARDLTIALPHQLTPEQREELVRSFVNENYAQGGMAADWAIHEPSRAGDDRNHHAHVMLTMRGFEGGAFGPKRREWNDPALVEQWRASWAGHVNQAFERHGVRDQNGQPLQADHRSYERQGVELEPTTHLGPAASSMERKGIATERGDVNREAQEWNRRRAHGMTSVEVNQAIIPPPVPEQKYPELEM